MKGKNSMSELKSQFDEKGFVIIDNFIATEYVAKLKQEVSGLSGETMVTDGSVRMHQQRIRNDMKIIGYGMAKKEK